MNQLNSNKSIILDQNPRLPLLIAALSITLIPLPFHPWPTITIGVFSIFLLIQSFTLKIEFTQEDFIVWQLGKELRRFPFKDWLAWRLFFPNLPGILYFREKASPHLLPILFDAKQLEGQLREKVGSLEIPSKQDSIPNP